MEYVYVVVDCYAAHPDEAYLSKAEAEKTANEKNKAYGYSGANNYVIVRKIPVVKNRKERK